MRFSDKVLIVNNAKTADSFPEVFSNEIYRSKTQKYGPIAYTSCYSIKYSLVGENVYTVNGTRNGVGAGSMLVVNEGSEVECTTPVYEEGLSIFLDKKLLQDVQLNMVNSQKLLIDSPATNTPLTLFYDQIIRREENRSIGSTLDYLVTQFNQNPSLQLTETYYYDLAELLLRTQSDIKIKIESINKARYSTRKEIFNRIQIVKEYLDDSINCRFDLENLSKEVALSKYHLIRCFREVYKTTPQKYFIQKKIELSKTLLKKNNVSEVARILSYRDIHSFSRQFKQVTGFSPSHYELDY